MDPNELFKNLILSYWPHLSGLLVLALLAEILRPPAIKGWLGERQIRIVLHRLDPAHYQCFQDLYLPRTVGVI